MATKPPSPSEEMRLTGQALADAFEEGANAPLTSLDEAARRLSEVMARLPSCISCGKPCFTKIGICLSCLVTKDVGDG